MWPFSGIISILLNETMVKPRIRKSLEVQVAWWWWLLAAIRALYLRTRSIIDRPRPRLQAAQLSPPAYWPLSLVSCQICSLHLDQPIIACMRVGSNKSYYSMRQYRFLHENSYKSFANKVLVNGESIDNNFLHLLHHLVTNCASISHFHTISGLQNGTPPYATYEKNPFPLDGWGMADIEDSLHRELQGI